MAFWAATLAGAIVVPLNAWWSGEELRYGLEDSGSKVVFVDTERAERIRPVLGGLPILGAVIVADEHRTEPAAPPGRLRTGRRRAVPEWPFPLALGAVDEAASPPDLTIDPEDDATIFYTSGTTGRPKGAVGTHRNMCTNLMSLFFINTRGATRFGSPTLGADRREDAGGFPPLRAAVPRHRLSLRHGLQPGGRREARDDAPLRSRARARADRAGEDRHVRRRAGHGHAGARLAQLLEVRHLLRPRRLLRRRTGAPRPGAPDPRGLAHRAALQRVRPDGDVVGHLHELGGRLRGQARERRPARAGLRRGRRAGGLRRRRAGRHAPPRARRPGRAVDQGPQRRARLLEPARRDGQDLHAGAGCTPATWPGSTRTTSSTSSTGPRT